MPGTFANADEDKVRRLSTFWGTVKGFDDRKLATSRIPSVTLAGARTKFKSEIKVFQLMTVRLLCRKYEDV